MNLLFMERMVEIVIKRDIFRYKVHFQINSAVGTIYSTYSTVNVNSVINSYLEVVAPL